MQLMIAAAPELRQTACAARLPVANTAYRLEGGYLCALPMPRSLQGGALLLTGWDGVWRDTAAQGILRECRARQYGAVIVPFPDPSLVQTLRRPCIGRGWRCGYTSTAPTPRPADGCWCARRCPAAIWRNA